MYWYPDNAHVIRKRTLGDTTKPDRRNRKVQTHVGTIAVNDTYVFLMQSFLEAVAEREVDAQRPFTAERVIQPEILEEPPCAMQSVLADADLVRLIGERLPSHIRLVLGGNLHTRATCRCARCNCRRACKLWRREIHVRTRSASRKQLSGCAWVTTNSAILAESPRMMQMSCGRP